MIFYIKYSYVTDPYDLADDYIVTNGIKKQFSLKKARLWIRYTKNKKDYNYRIEPKR